MKKALLVGAVVAIIAGILASVLGRGFDGSVTQPIPFNHDKHIRFGISCAACHVGAESRANPIIPNTPTCALCHVPGKPFPKTSAVLADYIKSGRNIPWKKIYHLQGYVRFSHMRHVGMAGLSCVDCHGHVGKMKAPITERAVPSEEARLMWGEPSAIMASCRDCHIKEKVTTSCMACHR